MPVPAERWTLITGSGIAFEGRCVLRHVFFNVTNTSDYIDIYDGRDDTVGKKFVRVVGTTTNARTMAMGDGVVFDAGIYISASDETSETMVAFDPLPE